MRGPALLVVEDLHWADEATLDVVRLVGRRLETLPLVAVLSYRDEHLDRPHPLRIVLGDLSSPGTMRLALGPLSADASRRSRATRGSTPPRWRSA